jgi:SET domain-containing protein
MYDKDTLTAVKLFPDMGRGVISLLTLKQEDVGMILMECELLVLDKNDTTKVNETELKHYTFKYTDDQDCLVLGQGEIFNHSDTPNVSYSLRDVVENGETRQLMIFKLQRPVKRGEQLFIDYNADTKVNTDEYKNSRSMY